MSEQGTEVSKGGAQPHGNFGLATLRVQREAVPPAAFSATRRKLAVPSGSGRCGVGQHTKAAAITTSAA